MESQMTHAEAHGQTHEKPHIVHNGGEDEHSDEKKSVLKKVKAKAKKIKDTLKKHGHVHGNNHDHDHYHVPDDHDLDEEDEEEEMIEDPEIHGAPLYEAEAIRSIGVVDSGVNTERSKAMEVDPRMPNVKPDESNIHGHGQRVNLGLTTLLGEVPGAPQDIPVSHATHGIDHHHIRDDPDHDPTRTFVYSEEERPGQPKVNLQTPKGLQEDPDAPKDTPDAYTPANYQTKVTDFSGEEAKVSPIVHSLDKMSIYDELKPKAGEERNLPTETEDFYTSVPTGSHDLFSPELSPPKRVTTEDHFNDNTADRPSNQSSYTAKISSVTSAIADKAVSAKDVVALKLGYGQKDHAEGHKMHGGDKSATAADYEKKIAPTLTEKFNPVCEKVAGAGSTIVSKMKGTGTTGMGNEGQDKVVSVKDYLAEKLRPGEEDRALSEVISETLHKRKVEQEKTLTSRPVSEVISDALHKETGEKEETNRPMGKVTESEEVARRLGTNKNDSSNEGIHSSSSLNSPGKGVVEKIKGAIGSWFGKGSEVGETEQDSGIVVERRLEESGN